MASHTSITKPQAQALKRFLATRLTSIDATVEELGMEDGMRIHQVFVRLPDPEEVEDKE